MYVFCLFLLVVTCLLLLTFANSLDPDHAQQNVRPDLNPNCFDPLMVFLEEFSKKSAVDKKACKITWHAKSENDHAYALRTILYQQT